MSTTPNVVTTLTSGTAASVTCSVSVPAVTGLSASPLSFSITPTTAGATQAVTIYTTAATPAGTYTIGVSCTGGVGTHTANFTLTVTSGAPLSADFSPTHTIAGTTQFNSTISGGSSPYTCSWSFGDSTPTQAGCNPTHTYANAGTFTVTLNVTDSAGSRATATHSVLVDQAPSPEAVLLSAESDRVLDGALANLAEERRAALLMRIDHGLGYGAIAAAMGWPLQKVKNEIHRARLQLRERLSGYVEGGAS